MIKHDPLGQAVTDYIDIISGKKPVARATINGEQELTNEQRARLPYVVAAKLPCVLCHAEPYIVGSWRVPAIMAEDARDQTIYFTMCKSCKDIENVMDRVTVELMNQCQKALPKPPGLQ